MTRVKALFAAFLFMTSGPLFAQSDSAPLPPLEDQGMIETVDPLLIVLERVQAYLASLDSFKARFRQMNPGGTQAMGTLYLQQPGRIRFDYDGDTPFLVVADGEVLSFVDYEVGQVTRWPVNDTPLKLFLSDTPDLSALNAQIQLNPAGLTDHVGLRASDPANPDQGVITVFFKLLDGDSRDMELVSWVVEDGQGRITVVELTEGEANPDLDKALWTFKDPRGLAKRRRAR